MCAQLAARSERLARAQRAFWDAWKAVSAGDRAQRTRAKEARAELESIHREISGLMYHLWAPRVRERAELASSYRRRSQINTDSCRWNNDTVRWLNQHDVVMAGVLPTVHVMRLRGSRRHVFPLEHRSMVIGASVTSDERIVAVELDRITVWQNRLGRYRVQEEVFLQGAHFYDAFLMPDETIVAADVSDRVDGRIYVSHKNDDGSREWMTLLGHRGAVLTVHPLPDGRILSGGLDGALRVWDVSRDDYTVESYEYANLGRILHIHANAHGRIAAISQSECTIWHVREDGRLKRIAEFDGAGRLEDVMVLPNGDIVLCNDKGGVYVYRQDANHRYVGSDLVAQEGNSESRSIDIAQDGRILMGVSGRIDIFEAKSD